MSSIQNPKSRIQNALDRLFNRHRIVFWYDEEESLRKDFDAIDLKEVEKVEIANNEFGLKYRLLREQPTQKFLIFKSGAQPADRDNWLFDVQLANTDFRTDKASLWLTELENWSEIMTSSLSTRTSSTSEDTRVIQNAKRLKLLRKQWRKHSTRDRHTRDSNPQTAGSRCERC